MERMGDQESLRDKWSSEVQQWSGCPNVPLPARSLIDHSPAISTELTAFLELDAPSSTLGQEYFFGRSSFQHNNLFPACNLIHGLKQEDLPTVSDQQRSCLGNFPVSLRNNSDTPPLFRGILEDEACPTYSLLNQSNQLLFHTNTSPFRMPFLENGGFLPQQRRLGKPFIPHVEPVLKVSSMHIRRNDEENAPKRPRLETRAPFTTFKVRKEKLGDRITELQQLVSPFGKTDTASVLFDATEYIKCLQDQLTVLCTPYLRLSYERRKEKGEKEDLRRRGLCLFPISTICNVSGDTSMDLSAPTFGGRYD